VPVGDQSVAAHPLQLCLYPIRAPTGYIIKKAAVPGDYEKFGLVP
jgi:hypothetical protein